MTYQLATSDRAVQAARFGKTEAEFVLIKARNQLIATDPYFATLVMSLQLVTDSKVEAMATNGVVIKYNPDFVQSLTLDECKGVLAHEALHCALLHHCRRDGRDTERWNIAGDYVVNDILTEAGYALPNGALIDKQYSGMSVEEVYGKLPYGKLPNSSGGMGTGSGNNNRNNQQLSGVNENGRDEILDQMGGNPNGGRDSSKGTDTGIRTVAPAWGKVEDYGPNPDDKPTTSEIEQQAADWQVKGQQALNTAKLMGQQVGEAITRAIKDAHDPKVPWREVIARFVEETARNDYTWQRPNTRYLQRGIILPSLLSKTYGQILIAVDTSGSVTDGEVSSMVSEILGILDLYEEDRGNTQLPIVYCDNKVRGFEWLGVDDTPNPSGGHGTDYRPVFNWLPSACEDEGIEPKAVVYLTDGECNKFPTESDIPVVWCLTGKNDSFQPPFGEVTNLTY